jgi:glucokinase
LVSETRTVPTPHGASHIIDAIHELIKYFQKDSVIAGIGIATAGIVNVEIGEVVGSTGNLPGWEGTPLKKIIESQTMLPVHVENDANASAYGECRQAQLSNKECIIVVTLGTGIGVGIILHGKVFRGAHYAAGECGHLKMSLEHKRLCTCGLWDCWEAYGSGRGLVSTGLELLHNVSPEQSALALKKDTLTTQAIIEAAQGGDIIAKRALHNWHEHVASGLASLAHTFDPDCFLITGGMSQFVDYNLLNELTQDRTLPRIAENLDIRPATLGRVGGMIGAAGIVIDQMAKKIS